MTPFLDICSRQHASPSRHLRQGRRYVVQLYAWSTNIEARPSKFFLEVEDTRFRAPVPGKPIGDRVRCRSCRAHPSAGWNDLACSCGPRGCKSGMDAFNFMPEFVY